MPLQNLELTFASNEDSLSVRNYEIRESLSGLFSVEVIARSEVTDLDLETIIGHGATFRVLGDHGKLRAWTGVCTHMEEIQAEETGLSTYLIRIAPTFFRTQLRVNARIFERVTLPDIVKTVLAEWEIEPELRLSAQYVKHEYRVQYNETDFAFVSRILEEAGITYFFEFQESQTKMVLTDNPGNGPSRAGGPLPFVEGHTFEGRQDFVTKVKLTSRVRTGQYTIRDFDFRLKPDYKLIQDHKDGIERELKLENYQYLPGSFWVESQGNALPAADDKGLYKSNEDHGKLRARLALESHRTGRRVVRMESNAIDLAPGKTFTIEQHPRRDLASKLVVASMSLKGRQDGEYEFHVEAYFADDPVRPLAITPRPRILGVQSAIVVGPSGEEIHTDEFGRVRVQFHWDREHAYSDESSCWIRVSQGWAGLGYGMITIPRVGQEVLVEFFDGDPDRPVITGRVYNNTSRVPYTLPEQKTKSGWKTDSSPGSNGFNELMFEDKKGAEEIHIQAERNFSEIVKRDQSSTVLNNRSASITGNDSDTVGKSLSVNVGDSEVHVVKKAHITDAGELHAIHVASGTGTEIRNRSIVSSTGGARIILDGDNIILEAKGNITFVANGTVRMHGKEEVQIESGHTFINCGEPGTANPQPFAKANDPSAPGSGGASNDSTLRIQGRGTVTPPGGIDEATPNLFVERPARSPETAAPTVALDAGAAAAVANTVAQTAAAPMATAQVGVLNRDFLQRGLTLVNAVRNFDATGGMSLLQVPEIRQAVGSVVTTPIVGQLTGKDFADVLNLGQRFGLLHLSEDAQAATAFVTAAAPEGTPNRAEALLGQALNQPLIGSLTGSDVADLVGQAQESGLIRLGDDAQQIVTAARSIPKPEGVTQMMAVRTDAAPETIDAAALDTAINSNVASGMPVPNAQANALARQGVALYRGDFSGVFSLIAGS